MRGRWWRWLGFRWVFPIGTLAVPYHPLVAWLLPWVAPALVVWGASSGDVAWWTLLLAAGVLGLALSVPIVVYALLVFRAPLVQGSLVGGAVLLLALDVAAGRVGWGWGVLPAAYVAVYLWQLVGGRVALARLRRGRDDVVAVDPPFGLVVAEGPRRHDVARWLLADTAVTMVCLDSSTWMRLDPDSLERVAELRDQVRSGYQIEREVLTVPGAESGPITVRTHEPARATWQLVTGDRLRVWEVEDRGRTQRLVSGPAEVVGLVPVFVCFYFLAVFGGRSRWVVGFPRRVAADLGEDRAVLLRAFRPRPEPPTYADPAGPLGTWGALAAERRDRYLAALDELERTPDEELARDQLAGLSAATGAGTAGTGARLCELLERGKRLRSRPLVEAAARALAHVPGAELRDLGRPS